MQLPAARTDVDSSGARKCGGGGGRRARGGRGGVGSGRRRRWWRRLARRSRLRYSIYLFYCYKSTNTGGERWGAGGSGSGGDDAMLSRYSVYYLLYWYKSTNTRAEGEGEGEAATRKAQQVKKYKY
jgi:hypothetical protein